jgi:hypothetical protein
VKREFVDKNKMFQLADVQQLVGDASDNVTVDNWEKCETQAFNFKRHWL